MLGILHGAASCMFSCLGTPARKEILICWSKVREHDAASSSFVLFNYLIFLILSFLTPTHLHDARIHINKYKHGRTQGNRQNVQIHQHKHVHATD